LGGHVFAWSAVVVLVLFVSAPLGVLGLTGVLLATFGRALGRIAQPKSVGQFLRSPLPWALLTVCALLSFAGDAMPPVGFTGLTVQTASGSVTGGLLADDHDGVYAVLCTSLANATSTGERISFIPRGAVKGMRIAGNDYVDSGARPSLVKLGLDVLGVSTSAGLSIYSPQLRAKQVTCNGNGPAHLSAGYKDPKLGVGVIAGPAPATAHATDAEAPIQQTTPTAISDLARKYEPTLLVTVADRNWPVSVASVLAERGPSGSTSCLVQKRAPQNVCPATLASLTGKGSVTTDYLQLPVALKTDHSPDGQFDAFLRGQGEAPPALDTWLSDPGLLDPWATAEFYFYYAGSIKTSAWPKAARNPAVPSGLVGLEYWFYYQYNYFPTVDSSRLMNGAPLAGDQVNTDFHQGDWEHVDVLLNPTTLAPEWLYLARHSNEGVFIRWTSPAMQFDDGHPMVQAAYGGHPSYLPGCGKQQRDVAAGLLADWLVCGSGRFAFRGTTTPVVDLARQSWACWAGHFGEATSREVQAANEPESELEKEIKEYVHVAGPNSPLRQAENTGVCKHDPDSAERAATKANRP
jgi:hypothetical protein